jgi:hypothetical protein
MSFKESSTRVYSDLKNHLPLVELLSSGGDSIYPLIASDKEGEEFVNYYIEDEGAFTKEGNHFLVVTRSYSQEYDSCCEIADKVKEAFGASENFYKNLGGRPQVSEDGWFYLEQKFHIKI